MVERKKKEESFGSNNKFGKKQYEPDGWEKLQKEIGWPKPGYHHVKKMWLPDSASSRNDERMESRAAGR